KTPCWRACSARRWLSRTRPRIGARRPALAHQSRRACSDFSATPHLIAQAGRRGPQRRSITAPGGFHFSRHGRHGSRRLKGAALMPITPLFNSPWGILANKREAKLASGAITRGAAIRPGQRSRYNAFGRSDTSTSPLGMGYVEAVLGVLMGIVGTIS